MQSQSPLKRSDPLYAAILTLLAFLNFYRGLAPSVTAVFDDSLEFALVVHRLAIAHPTGYPLYILLGKVFSLFNPHNIAYQLNLMSAVFAALSVGALYLLGVSLAPENNSPTAYRLGSGLGALLFATGPVFYSQAVAAEVYTLNALFVAAILLLTLQKRWLWLAFAFGLSLTHHRTTLLLLPAIFLFIAATYGLHRRAGWKQLWRDISPLKLLIAFVAPLLLYLYLPLRGHVGTLEGDYQNTLTGFWKHVTGGGYGAFLFGNPFGNERSLSFYMQLMVSELNWWGVGLAIGGVGWLLYDLRLDAGNVQPSIVNRQSKIVNPKLLLTGTAFLSYLIFNLFYTVTDIEVFFIPNFLLLALWAGLATGVILDLIGRRVGVLAIGLAAALLIVILTRQRGQSRSEDWAVHNYALDALAQPAPGAAVVGIQGEMTLLRYFQETQGFRPDLRTYRADGEAERLAQVDSLLAEDSTHPVYLTRELPGAAERWSLSAAGPLIRVNPEPFNSPPPVAREINAAFTPQIILRGYAIQMLPSNQTHALPPLRLTLLWQATQPVTANLKVSARLLDSAGDVAAVVDGVPVHFAYPTPFWRPGEYILDAYDLRLPPDAPSGDYTPLIILYNPANNAAEVGRVTLPPINVSPQ